MKLNILITGAFAVLVIAITLFVEAKNDFSSIYFWIGALLFIASIMSWRQAIKEAEIHDKKRDKIENDILKKLDIIVGNTNKSTDK